MAKLVGRIMRTFKLDRLSSVDRPAQAGAVMTIMKRDASDGRPADSAAFAKSMVEKLGITGKDAETFQQALAQQVNWDNFWKLQNALQESVQSIVTDDALTADGKRSMIQASLSQFEVAMMKMFGDMVSKGITAQVRAGAVCDTLSKYGYRFSADGGIENQTEGDSMALKDLAKKYGLPETATEAQILEAIEKADKIAKDAAAVLESVTKLSPDAKVYYDGIEKAEDKTAFLAKSADDQIAFMKAWPKKKPAAGAAADPTDDDEATVKRLVEKGIIEDPAVVKKRNTDFDDMRKRDRLTSFTKRAEPLKLIGKAEDIGTLFMDISDLGTGGDAVAKRVEDLFTALNARIEKGALFSEAGSNLPGRQFGKAATEINSAAAELLKGDWGQANPGRTIEAARAEVRKRQPDLAKREKDERKEAA